MPFKILHLSDLHFKVGNVLQEKVTNSLVQHVNFLIQNGIKYDIIVITGDIAFSGKMAEYEIAKKFFQSLIAAAGCKKENVYIIPGNHDVDRSTIQPEHLQWWYQFNSEEQLSINLSSAISFPILIQKNENFFEFVKGYASLSRGKYGEFSAVIQPDKSNVKIRLIGLNSSLFCGYDGDDKEHLALGIDQVDNCFDCATYDYEIVIAMVHHPKKCYHLCERPTLATIDRKSDIILSGHLHSEEVSSTNGANTGQTINLSAGASYENKNHTNSFNDITIELTSGDSQVRFFKYLPTEHQWIQNRDISYSQNGVFQFSLQSKIQMDQSPVGTPSSSSCYRIVLDASFKDLDREKFNKVVSELQTVTKDATTKVIKMENGSIKLYFETKNELDPQIINSILDIQGIDVIEFKKVSSEDIHLKTGEIDKSVYHWKTFLKSDFANDLNNAGTNFSHNRVDSITLKDLFVIPNLKRIRLDKDKQKEKIVAADVAMKKLLGETLKVVIYGDDTSGKTTLARWAYEKLYDDGYVPILINGNLIKDIKESKILNVLQTAFEQQYNGLEKGRLTDYEKDRIIIIIDDFHRIRLKEPRFKAAFIRSLESLFTNIVLTSSDLMQYESYATKSGSEIYLLGDFGRFAIVEFGPKLRYELIKKWNFLGQNQLEANELIRLNNDSQDYVDSIIGKNFVPPYPIYILTILQAREAITTTQKPEYSIHGFYYEILINDALNKAVTKKEDISLYYNYITEYAYFLFDQDIRLDGMSIESFNKFHDFYCREYNILINLTDVLDTLVSSRLLKVKTDHIFITYKYVYYFFVAKYIANNISTPVIRQKVKALCQRVHRDEYASIVMYLTHLSKDQFVINELLTSSRELFSEFEPVRLQGDVSFINDMINNLPKQIYEPIDVETAKDEELKNSEEMEQLEKELEAQRKNKDYSIYEDISALDMISKMIKAIKTIEIVGQVTKKYWGELKAGQKFDLAEETYMLGLRTLNFYFSLLSEDIDLVAYYVNHLLRKRYNRQNLNKAEIDRATKTFLFSLCSMASFGIIKKVTNAIGYDKLAGTLEDVLKKHDYNSVYLIDTSIKLDYNSRFPWNEVIALKEKFESNFVAKAVLQNLVINYLYVFHTSIEEKQRICSYLGISMEAQRQIEAQSVVRRD